MCLSGTGNLLHVVNIQSNASNGSLVRCLRLRGPVCRALVLLVVSSLSTFAAVIPYAGAIGGVATLSADAGSASSTTGLNLSAYSPANGGALNIFVGAHVHSYFSF